MSPQIPVPVMSHLSAERLAALADAGEPLSAPEAEHLAWCRICAREREAYRTLVAGARTERSAIGAPLTQWEAIAGGLRATGTAVTTPRPAVGRRAVAHDPVVVRHDFQYRLSGAVRIAAGILLLVGGVAAGRMSAVAGPLAVRPVGASDDLRPPGGAGSLPAAGIPFASVPDAQAALARYESGYQQAAAYLAEHDTAAWLDAPDDYRTRLAALERVGRTMREAIEDAPYDPVLTGYYLTTLGQREATLRQLNVATPASARLNTF